MKRIYTAPALELTKLESNDVIATSVIISEGRLSFMTKAGRGDEIDCSNWLA